VWSRRCKKLNRNKGLGSSERRKTNGGGKNEKEGEVNLNVGQ